MVTVHGDMFFGGTGSPLGLFVLDFAPVGRSFLAQGAALLGQTLGTRVPHGLAPVGAVVFHDHGDWPTRYERPCRGLKILGTRFPGLASFARTFRKAAPWAKNESPSGARSVQGRLGDQAKPR